MLSVLLFPFHRGELKVQHKAGTRGVAVEVSDVLSQSFQSSPAVKHMFENIRMAWLASLSYQSHQTENESPDVWVSPVFGRPGFIRVNSNTSFSIDLQQSLPTNDILWSNIRQENHQKPLIAFLALDAEHRRRYRTNGSIQAVSSNHVAEVAVSEAFPNCPKYIQKRFLSPLTLSASPLPQPSDTNASNFHQYSTLSEQDTSLITAADTFFLGTYFEETGLDVSHRGGNLGFVRVLSPQQLYWPEYPGNGMFQSLGNLEVNDRAGITFFDYSTGHLLQISGHATVVWNAREVYDVESAAERVVRLDVEKVRRSVLPVTNYRWNTTEFSPYNPIVSKAHSTDEVENRTFPMQVKLVKIVQESQNVKTFRFLSPERIIFLPGQYAMFEFEGLDIQSNHGSAINRTWTLSEAANSVDGDLTLEISVKRKPDGLISNWLHQQAKVGEVVKLLGIGGEMTPFSNPDFPQKLLFISGGIGMTPNMAILRGIGARMKAEDIDSLDAVFIHQERHIEDMPFRAELARRARKSNGRIRSVTVVSGGDSSADKEDNMEEGSMRFGRVNKQLVSDFAPDAREREVYLCGPPGFMKQVTAALLELGVPTDKIVTEDFSF